MHYRNGREAKNGDIIVSLNGGKVVAFGVLHGATPGNDYCNGNIAPSQSVQSGACMCDALHVDDLAAILAEKGGLMHATLSQPRSDGCVAAASVAVKS